MTRPASRNFRTAACALGALAMLSVLPACGSAPTGQGAGPGPRNTGTYPNLNIPPEKAAKQFTDSEHAANVSALTQKRTAAQETRADLPRDETSQLSALGRTHGKRALKAIED